MNNYSEKFEKMRVAGNLAARTLDMLTENRKELSSCLTKYCFTKKCDCESYLETKHENYSYEFS